MTCGAQVLLDDEDYDRLPKSGWYLSDENHGKDLRKTRYAVHDTYGRMHRFILNYPEDKYVIDHIDGNGLNNQKNNLRIVTTSLNKRNQKTIKSNKFNFNGISLEKGKYPRIRVMWSAGEPELKSFGYAAETHSKSWGLISNNYNYNKILKEAVLFRLQKMKENNYLIDERSTTIEKRLLEEENPNMEEILGINFKEIFE